MIETVEEVTGLTPVWDETVNIHHNYAREESVTYEDHLTHEVKEEVSTSSSSLSLVNFRLLSIFMQPIRS